MIKTLFGALLVLAGLFVSAMNWGILHAQFFKRSRSSLAFFAGSILLFMGLIVLGKDALSRFGWFILLIDPTLIIVWLVHYYYKFWYKLFFPKATKNQMPTITYQEKTLQINEIKENNRNVVFFAYDYNLNFEKIQKNYPSEILKLGSKSYAFMAENFEQGIHFLQTYFAEGYIIITDKPLEFSTENLKTLFLGTDKVFDKNRVVGIFPMIHSFTFSKKPLTKMPIIFHSIQKIIITSQNKNQVRMYELQVIKSE